MATKNIRMRPEGSGDYGDILHPETNADQIVETATKKVMTADERTKLGGIGAGQLRNITLSTADPSGGSNGDVWIKYTP